MTAADIDKATHGRRKYTQDELAFASRSLIPRIPACFYLATAGVAWRVVSEIEMHVTDVWGGKRIPSLMIENTGQGKLGRSTTAHGLLPTALPVLMLRD